MLLSLPEELVSHIALHLLASQPFKPPYVLNSLHLTCRSLHQLLRSDHFKARAFGVCFDVGSEGRRSFVADTGMRADQFEVWGVIVHWISERDVAGGEADGEHEPSDAQFTLLSAHPWDVAETFLQAYIMLVSNDGKNLAQLEHAGLYSLLRAYLKKYLYKEELLDKGWPVESLENSCALWLLWMMTTEDRLNEESLEEREEMVKMVLPWVMVPFRYSAAHAPPSHYTLPLSPTLFIPQDDAAAAPSQSNTHGRRRRRRPFPSYNLPHSVMTSHGPYPIYGPTVLPRPTPPSPSASPTPPDTEAEFPSVAMNATSFSASQVLQNLPYTPTNSLNVSYFGTRCPFSVPLPSMAAKMLYFSRRERVGFSIPPHLPATREEAIRLAREAWESEQRENGLVVGENGVVWDGRMRVGPTKEDIVYFNGHKGTQLPVRTSWYDGWDGPDALSIPPSLRWDNDYYRSRYCYDVFLERGRRNGDVYTPGMLDGLWQGRMLVPSENRFLSLMTAPHLPVDPNSRVEGRPDYLTEEYLFTATVPVYMRLDEYHWLDGSKRRKDRTRSTFLASDQPLGDRLAALDEEATQPGGIVRCAERVNRIDEGMKNAWFPQGTGLVMDDDAVKVYAPPANLTPPAQSSPFTRFHHYQEQMRQVVPSMYEKYHATEPNSHNPEYCAECLRREEEKHIMRLVGSAEDEEAMKRRQMSTATGDDNFADDFHGMSREEEVEEASILRDRLGDGGVENIFRSVGLGPASRWRRGETISGVSFRRDVDRDYVRSIPEADMDVDDAEEEGGEDGGEWMDVDTEGDDEDEDDASCASIGDADLPADDPLVLPPCNGVRDILVLGSTDPPHALAWHPFVFRGRIRPWDGLVGILRVSKDRQLGDAFFYGYIVGGKNFVGNWRNVGAETDAGMPAWEGPFSMSKRE
ncbi:hypothetical protein BDN71DRAFT_1447235 [Pleurotus eryngii]|uniref:F-box domain-containing protein n=1 Tax=Pleurotus eryngii TaxID=5323 RepID=A0A9P6A0D8_PLEER|nr:hypothetical protein BDN71DRAFT_1447235 [Pleurotus eryngii]